MLPILYTCAVRVSSFAIVKVEYILPCFRFWITYLIVLYVAVWSWILLSLSSNAWSFGSCLAKERRGIIILACLFTHGLLDGLWVACLPSMTETLFLWHLDIENLLLFDYYILLSACLKTFLYFIFLMLLHLYFIFFKGVEGIPTQYPLPIYEDENLLPFILSHSTTKSGFYHTPCSGYLCDKYGNFVVEKSKIVCTLWKKIDPVGRGS